VVGGDDGGGWWEFLGVGCRNMPATLISVFLQGRSLEARIHVPNCCSSTLSEAWLRNQ
jgi:hypothetical protein